MREESDLRRLARIYRTCGLGTVVLAVWIGVAFLLLAAFGLAVAP